MKSFCEGWLIGIFGLLVKTISFGLIQLKFYLKLMQFYIYLRSFVYSTFVDRKLWTSIQKLKRHRSEMKLFEWNFSSKFSNSDFKYKFKLNFCAAFDCVEVVRRNKKLLTIVTFGELRTILTMNQKAQILKVEIAFLIESLVERNSAKKGIGLWIVFQLESNYQFEWWILLLRLGYDRCSIQGNKVDGWACFTRHVTMHFCSRQSSTLG